MKRTLTQKLKHVPTGAPDTSDAPFKLSVEKHSAEAAMPTEVNRKARTSAAMIGLAISMGASSLLLPQKGDRAMAIEPIGAEPTITNLPVENSTSVSSSPAVEPQVVAAANPPAPVKPEVVVDSKPNQAPVIEHQVQQGETLWEVSKTYEVQPEAIAASNRVQPDATLSVGETLKIPAENGIVHEVQAGETVETISESYGVEPKQLKVPASVSESSQLPTGEAVTVSGDVDELLKVRQEVALNRLKEQQNRLSDSLAELRSEEYDNLAESAAVPSSTIGLQPEGNISSSPKPMVIPVPTPEVAVSPTVEREINSSQPGVRVLETPVVIPVPTPEVAVSPTVEREINSSQPVVRVPNGPVVIPVPTPEVAASPTLEQEATETKNLAIEPVTIPENTAEPQAPQPVVVETLVRENTASVYQVKPGDTIDEIAHNYDLTPAELVEANDLDNPHVIQIDQKLKIPQSQSVDAPSETVTLLPGIRANLNPDNTRQQQIVGSPVVPTVPQSVTRPVLAQSISVDNEPANSTNRVNTENNQSDESKYPPHLQRLMAEIEKMREEYRHQGTSSQVTAQTITVPVAESLSNQSKPARINPEFNPNTYNESIQLNQSRQQQQLTSIPIAVPPPELSQPRQQQPRLPVQQQASIPIAVPPPERSASNSQSGLFATAPVPGQIYNGNFQPQPGETVSPQLPPLSAPDMYLPDSPARFNGYIWPTKGVITSGFGMRWGRMHKGLDIAAATGTPIVAAAPGVVVTAGWNNGGYGNLVEIEHPDGSLTLYAHNNRILVQRGQEVAQGQQISEMGSTGYSTGPHLHFEVHPSGSGAVNPIAYLPQR